MAYILRKIRKPRWYRDDLPTWLAADELPADVMADLNTTSNELSVWLVKDDLSNLDQVATALASTVDSISNLDYALLEQNFIAEQFKLQEAAGNTPYAEANVWHRDLVELSALKLYALAKSIFEHADRKRYSEKEIRKLIARAIAKGHIDRTKLKLTQGDMNAIDRLVAEIEST